MLLHTPIHLSTGHTFKAVVENMCQTIQVSEEELDELDRGSGDGDCGTTLKAGADGSYMYL